jgi:hypothetical protein
VSSYPFISLVRIHNNETLQGSIECEELLRTLADSKSIAWESIEVFEQPILLGTSEFGQPRRTVIKRRSNQRKLEILWSSHLKKRFLKIRKLKSFIGQVLHVSKVCFSSRTLSAELRILQIERFVTAKHIEGLRRAASSGASLVVVLEADATVHENSLHKLDEILNVFSMNKNHSLYFNIAGGLGYAEIGIHPLARKFSESMDVFDIPVSNTSCAYAVTENFIRGFLSFIEANVEVLDFGVDWVFNSYFMNARDEVICIHSNPPALSHGSFTGTSESWNPKNRSR